jgi:hypothetical protein
MAAATLFGPDGLDGPQGPRRRSPITPGRAMAAGGIALAVFVLWTFFNAQIVTERPNEMKTTTVILPPPPPPPPPEPKPVEQPPEPTAAPPVEQPVDTPPPEAKSDPAPGDNALTAREGAGPSNYGLAVGNGGGTRIGGRPGGSGDAFRAYASVAQGCIQRAAQADRDLTRGRYRAELVVTMTATGRIANARIAGVDDQRSARIRGVLNGLQCQAPPAGLPAMRLEINARSGG